MSMSKTNATAANAVEVHKSRVRTGLMSVCLVCSLVALFAIVACLYVMRFTRSSIPFDIALMITAISANALATEIGLIVMRMRIADLEKRANGDA